MANNGTVCPKCGSTNIFHAKKGYSILKVIVLTVLTLGLFGIWALLAGFFGRNKVQCKCLDCGKKWYV